MMRKAKAVLVAILMAAAFMAVGAQPAAAAETGSITFQGVAEVSPGLSYNLNAPDKPDPQSFTWNFQSTIACAALVDSKKHDLPQASTCEINVSGDGEGYCGWSIGFNGAGTITAGNPAQSYTVTDAGWDKVANTGTASVLLVTGDVEKDSTGQDGDFTAVVQATPVPGPGNSCLDGTATDFLVTGEATFSIS